MLANDKIEKQAPAVSSVRPSSRTRVMVRSVVSVVVVVRGTLLCYWQGSTVKWWGADGLFDI